MFGTGLLDQDATAGRLMTGSSPIGAMVSSVMYLARWTAHLMAWIAPVRTVRMGLGGIRMGLGGILTTEGKG